MILNLDRKLKTLRESNNLSIQQMCDIIEVELRTYDKIEHGQRELSISEVKNVCEFFKLDMQEFMFGEPKIVFENCNHSANVGINKGNIVNKELKEFFEKIISLFEKITNKD